MRILGLYVSAHGKKGERHWRVSREGTTVLKGWFGRSKVWAWPAVEFAVGGEDNMVQAKVSGLGVAVAAGFRVPRSWTRAWIYDRREWGIQLNWGGQLVRVTCAHDWRMRDMEDYYRRLASGEEIGLTRAQLWPGWDIGLSEAKLKNLLLGRQVHTKRDVGESVPVEIVMPEGTYHGTATIRVSTRKRPRWRLLTRQSVEIKLANPPKFAGKGENSWDIEDDGFFSATFPEATVDEAVAGYRDLVLTRRARHGQPSIPAENQR